MLRKSELLFPSTSKRDSIIAYYDQFESDSSSGEESQWEELGSDSHSSASLDSRARTPIAANLVAIPGSITDTIDITDTEEGGNVVVDNPIISLIRTATTNQSPADPSDQEDDEDEEYHGAHQYEPVIAVGTRTHESARSTKQGQMRRYLILALTLASLFLAIVVVAVFQSRRGYGFHHSSAVGAPTVTTGAPNSRQQLLDSIIGSISNETDLTQPNSPQALARDWLLLQDPLQLNPANVTRARVTQRYVLAVFYYATGGSSSWKQNHWLLDNECGDTVWDGLNCDERNQVRGVVLDNFGLSGTIPSELCLITSLENLILKNNNHLTGTIPTAIGHLRKLIQLGLYNNTLTGKLPQTLFGASSLRFLNLQDNQLSGTFFANLSMWKTLETLVLMNNRLQGSIPWEELETTKLIFLGLSGNNFSATVSPAIGNATNLRFLYLDSNNFTGIIPTEIGLLTNLESLNLDQNKMSGAIPRQIECLTNLIYLSMQGNLLAGLLPSGIANLTNIETINLATNSLVGTIPEFTKLHRLINLFLYQNELSGGLPESFFDLDRLQILFLSSNRLNGSISMNLSNGKSAIRGLYLSNNSLSGSIPKSLCSVTALEALFLDSNEITATIPTCVGALERLKQFYVFQNRLSGSIPNGLSNLTLLEGMGLENNKLVGSVPSAACSLNVSNLTISADCGGTAPVKCTCCTVCCPSSQCSTKL